MAAVKLIVGDSGPENGPGLIGRGRTSRCRTSGRVPGPWCSGRPAGWRGWRDRRQLGLGRQVRLGDRLAVGGCRMVGRRLDEEVMEAAREVPLEAAQRALVGLPFGFFAFEERLGLGVDAGAGDRDDVQRPVELAVAAAVQSVLAVLPGGARDRCDPGLQREARVALEPFGAGGAADQDRGDERAAAGLLEQPRTLGFDQLEQLLLERVDLAGQSADLGEQLARDPCPDAGGSRRRRRSARSSSRASESAPGFSDASSSGHSGTRCHRSRDCMRVRSATRSWRWSESSRTSIACSSRYATGNSSTPSLTTARAIASASI